MKGRIEEVKEIIPMFPRLHVKDVEKGGPKAPPRNKMALYEQLAIPSQDFASGSSPSKFHPLLRHKSSVPSTSSVHVGCSQGIQYSNPSVSSYLAGRIHAYHSRSVNLTKLLPDDYINRNKSLKAYEQKDALVPPDSTHAVNSYCNINKNKEDEDTLAHCKPSCSLKSQNSFSKKVDLITPTKLNSARFGKNQKEDHIEVNQIDQNKMEGPAHLLDGFGDMTDESSISSVKVRTKPMKRAHTSLMEEYASISVGNLKILQSSNGQTNEEGGELEKPALSDVFKCPGGLEGRKFLKGKRDMHKSEDMSRHYDALNKSIPNSIGMDITPDDVLGAIGEKNFWTTRRTIINQQKIFVLQVFELHRLIKVQKLIAGSPDLLLEDNLQLNKPSQKLSAPKKLQSDYFLEQPSSNAKLNNTKSEKPSNVECAESTSLGKIPLHCVNNNMNKGLTTYGHHSGNRQLALPSAANMKPSSCYIYPAPGNQWLVPFMSPSEGLIYKPFVGPCPPNAGFMGPVYGACNPVTLTPGNKDISVSDVAHVPYIFPSCGSVMHPSSISAFASDQINPPTKMMQSNGTENNHQSAGDVNSPLLQHQGSSNMSSQMSQVMSRHVTNDNHPSEDKELQTSTGSSQSKRMKGDALPLFPTAPTFWALTDHQKAKNVEDHQPPIIKAIPHNPKSTTESVEKIFRSIQEERKHL